MIDFDHPIIKRGFQLKSQIPEVVPHSVVKRKQKQRKNNYCYLNGFKPVLYNHLDILQNLTWSPVPNKALPVYITRLA